MYKCWRNLSHDIESKHKNQFSGNNEAKPKFEVGIEQWQEVLHEGFCHCLAMSLEEKCFRTTTSVKVKPKMYLSKSYEHNIYAAAFNTGTLCLQVREHLLLA